MPNTKLYFCMYCMYVCVCIDIYICSTHTVYICGFSIYVFMCHFVIKCNE